MEQVCCIIATEFKSGSEKCGVDEGPSFRWAMIVELTWAVGDPDWVFTGFISGCG